MIAVKHRDGGLIVTGEVVLEGLQTLGIQLTSGETVTVRRDGRANRAGWMLAPDADVAAAAEQVRQAAALARAREQFRILAGMRVTDVDAYAAEADRLCSLWGVA